MTDRTARRRPEALRGMALGSFWLPLFWLPLFWTQQASAQPTAPDAGEPGDCTRSREPHECAERCPSFDTCFVAEDGQLYYRVMSERFQCAGLDCNAASVQLGDYCCERGEYAPSRGDGGGCALTAASAWGRASPGGRSSSPGLGALGVLSIPLLLVRRRVRARR